MTKTIEIIVSPTGKSQVVTKGFVGGECKQASRFIEQTLGKQLDEQLTPEFYASGSEEHRLREGQ